MQPQIPVWVRFPAATGQTVITLGCLSSCTDGTAAITAGETANLKGLQYKLKSGVLKTEIGGTVSGMAAGAPSANVTISSVKDLTIVSSAVGADGKIYIAYTGNNGGGDDAFSVQVQNVVSSDGSGMGSFVKATLTDTGNLLNGGSSQQTFDVGAGGTGTLAASGFKYPLKFTAADELGNPINISALTSLTYNGVAPYYSTTTIAYFATSTTLQTLVVTKAGFEPADANNTGLVTGSHGVSTNQTTQTSITFDTSAADTSSITAGSTVTMEGLRYILKSNALKTELTGAITDIAAGSENTGSGLPSADATITAGAGVTLVATAVSGNAIYIAATRAAAEEPMLLQFNCRMLRQTAERETAPPL